MVESCKSSVVDKKVVENFNSWIVEGRHMLIRTMVEFIRNKTMKRLGIKGSLCEKWINCYSPACNDIFHIYKGLVVRCESIFNGDTGYQVQKEDDTHIVCLNKKICTCWA